MFTQYNAVNRYNGGEWCEHFPFFFGYMLNIVRFKILKLLSVQVVCLFYE